MGGMMMIGSMAGKPLIYLVVAGYDFSVLRVETRSTGIGRR
jgi:hypothetical protein